MDVRRLLAVAARGERYGSVARRHRAGARVLAAREPKLLRAATRLAVARTRVAWAPAVVAEFAEPSVAPTPPVAWEVTGNYSEFLPTAPPAPVRQPSPASVRQPAPSRVRQPSPAPVRQPSAAGPVAARLKVARAARATAAPAPAPRPPRRLRPRRPDACARARRGAGDHAGEPRHRAGELRVAVR